MDEKPGSDFRLSPSQPEQQEAAPEGAQVLRDINALSSDINAYNEQFSMGHMMAGVVLGMMGNDEEAPRIPAESMEHHAQSQAITADALATAHQGILNQTGIGIEPVVGKTATMIHEDIQIGTGEMRVNIADRRQFLSFLSSLTPEQVRQSGANAALSQFGDILAQQLLDNTDLRNPAPETLELLGGLEGILGQFKRLSIEGDGVDQLTTYLVHSRQGNLREFVAIQQTGLMQEPGKGFGPGDWQTDSTPEFLEARWSRALAILESTRQNPKAAELYGSLKEHLATCAQHALDFLEANPAYWPTGRMAEMTNILRQVQHRI